MKSFSICCFALLLLKFYFVSSFKLTEIYNETFDAIGRSNEILKKTLLKYYLTDEKENSIWWLANRDSLQEFNIPLGIKDLISMETTIKKTTKHFRTCSELEENKRKSQCFNRFTELLEGGERDFFWDISSDVSSEGKAKIGTQYTVYSVYTASIAVVTTEKLYLLNDWTRMNGVINSFISIIQSLMRMLFVFEKDVTKWRCDQISAVDICEINNIFWKEFQSTCETRWKRDVDGDVAEISGNGTEIKQFDDSDNDNPSLNIADRIGKYSTPYAKTYKATVTDHVTKKKLFEKEIIIQLNENRGMALIKLHKEGMETRWVEEKKVRKIMKKYHAETIKIARKIMHKALNYLEKSKRKYFK